jgi:two-component system nitrogen regulation response regulator NtrX
MPDVDGITLLKEWSEVDGLPMPVIMMSGHGTVETAVEATRLGAYDFIEKPLSLAKLLLTIERALEADKLNRENQGLRKHSYALEEPLAARYLHRHSLHRDRPFIEVNVGSLSAENSVHELFGSEVQDKVHYGLLEQANGGTLLLHDIADMDATTQGKLYSALESGSFQRSGANTTVDLQVRVIAATHQNLTNLVDQGRLRKDLFFLLNVVPIQIPPLREHIEDVPEILNFFVNLYVEHDNLPYRKFSTAAQNRLRNYHWPGNIRELMNLVQRLLIVGAGSEISLEEVEVALGSSKPVAVSKPAGFATSYDLPLREAREQFERDYLEHQLRQAGGSVGKVAKMVGLERTHLYRKLRSLGIDPKRLDSE